MPTPSDRAPSDLSDASVVDAWLASLLGDEAGTALLAVGSFGRGDHAPRSDLDLVLIHDGHRDIAAVADRVWYPIWDAGLGLDHSVRTPKQVLTVAAGDLKVALGLLDGRVVAGDPVLGGGVVAEARAQWVKRSRQFLPALAAAVRERHQRFGEVAFLLEPDVKEGAGGLRDAAAIRAVGLAIPEVADRAGPVPGAEAVLRRARVALHRRTGRALDRLLLEEQDGIAAELAYMGADQLMAAVSEAARAIGHVGEDAWRRIDALGGRGWRGRWVKPTGQGLLVRDGELAAANGIDATDPVSPLLVAAEAARHGATVSRQLLLRFEKETPVPGVPWPASLRQALVDLLGQGRAAIGPIEALDHHGLLVRLLPEWAAVRHRPQRNAYHRFTVDRHLLETAANAAEGAVEVGRRDLLVVAALLHDIGKGFPGDHTAAGVEVVRRVAPRMGFDHADTDTLVTLVRHHLLLAETATRRDLDDPATAAGVAAAVGSAQTLRLLWALTVADSLATGPAAWSDWKAGLVRDLAARAAALLGDDLGPEPVAAGAGDGADATSGPGGVARVGEERVIHDADGLAPGLHGRGHRCLVVADDRPGVLSAVTGVLAVHGLDVRGAQVGARLDGSAVEVIDVVPGERMPDWEAVARDVDAALNGDFPIAERLAARAAQYAPLGRRSGPTTPDTSVVLDNRASDRATVVEVRGPDTIGVLHAITQALTGSGLDIRWARAQSLGHEVIDTFYVVDAATGTKLFEAGRLAAVEAAVRAALC